MAHAAERVKPAIVLDAADAPEAIREALGRWADAQVIADIKRGIHDRLRGTPQSWAALSSYLDASKWAAERWAAVEAAMPFDVGLAYRVAGYVVSVTPISRRGKTHVWRRAERI